MMLRKLGTLQDTMFERFPKLDVTSANNRIEKSYEIRDSIQPPAAPIKQFIHIRFFSVCDVQPTKLAVVFWLRLKHAKGDHRFEGKPDPSFVRVALSARWGRSSALADSSFFVTQEGFIRGSTSGGTIRKLPG